MKNLIISIVLLCFATIATAQKKYDRNWCVTYDSASVKTICDSLVKLCNYKYEFYRAKMKEYRYLLYYKSISSPDSLVFSFQFYMEGKNEALERPGTPRYELKFMIGRFLDLFPIYKKYGNPNADIEKASKFGDSVSGIKSADGAIWDIKYSEFNYNDKRWTISRD